MKSKMYSRPSDRAVQAAARAMLSQDHNGGPAQGALEAAHAPTLGLDRSVCLRDVVDALRGDTSARPPGTYQGQSNYNNMNSYAEFIEREFTDGPLSSPTG